MPNKFSLLSLLGAITLVCIGLAVKQAPRGTVPQLLNTERQLDVAIVGPGYFQVVADSGRTYYTRVGRFVLNADGAIALENGAAVVEPLLMIPPETKSINVGTDGRVRIQDSNSPLDIDIGYFEVFTFPDGGSLRREADTELFSYLNPQVGGNPVGLGSDGESVLLQGWLASQTVEHRFVADWPAYGAICCLLLGLLASLKTKTS